MNFYSYNIMVMLYGIKIGDAQMIRWIKNLWHDLNQNIFVGDRLQKNLIAITIVSVISALFGIVMIIVNVVSHADLIIILSSVFFIVSGTASAIASGIFKARKVSVVIATITSIIIFTYYAITGGIGGFSIVWATLMPIGVSYFLGVKYGFFTSIYYELLCIVLFYTPLRETMSKYYPEEIMLRYPIIYLVLIIFTLVAMVQYHRMVLRDNTYVDRLNEEVNKQTAVAIERLKKLEQMSDEIVNTLAVAIDAKDRYTNGHSFRVAAYSSALVKELGWNDEDIHAMHQEAMLHDIGKIGISDLVLNKPGRLSDEEFETIKQHSTIGGKILGASGNLISAAYVARYHHERYDGGGYPSGLKGESIPLHARVVSIADAYDAMRSDRIYRKGLSADIIRKELINGRGTQFDPNLLDVFIKLFDEGKLDEITTIANKQLAAAVDLGLIDENR